MKPTPLLLLLFGLAACASGRPAWKLDSRPVHDQLEAAQSDLEAGATGDAVDRLLAVRRLRILSPEERSRAEVLLERAAETFVDQLVAAGDTDALDDLFDSNLPGPLRALAGVSAAEVFLAEGDRVAAVDQVIHVENELPLHVQRSLAARILSEAGLSLIQDDGRFRLIYSYRSKGIDALDFLVLRYPGDPSCPEAYLALGRAYEEDDELHDAIDRYADLALYHADTPYSVTGEARLPYLRLKRLERDDYDRGELVLALIELDTWLAKHAGMDLEPWVREVRVHCLARLARSDLGLAAYYEKIGNPMGTHLHAERALAEAREAGDEGLAEQARDYMERTVEARGKRVEEGPPTWADEEDS